jgi:hypothetical protein
MLATIFPGRRAAKIDMLSGHRRAVVRRAAPGWEDLSVRKDQPVEKATPVPGRDGATPDGVAPDLTGGPGGRGDHQHFAAYSTLKRLLVGRPLATQEAETQRLPKRIALAVFSSDAVSSTAYGTEEILTVLVPVAGVAAIGYLVPISLLLVGVLIVLVLSYRQTIYAYPTGGGSYIVSRENLGTSPSLVAAASLLVDYTLKSPCPRRRGWPRSPRRCRPSGAIPCRSASVWSGWSCWST